MDSEKGESVLLKATTQVSLGVIHRPNLAVEMKTPINDLR